MSSTMSSDIIWSTKGFRNHWQSTELKKTRHKPRLTIATEKNSLKYVRILTSVEPMIHYVLISYILIQDVLKFTKNEVIHEIGKLFHRILRYIYKYIYIYIYIHIYIVIITIKHSVTVWSFQRKCYTRNRAYFTKIRTNYIDLTMKLILFDDSHS